MDEFIACPYCGKKFRVGEKCCPHCGIQLPDLGEEQILPMSSSKWKNVKKSHRTRWTVAGVLLVSYILFFHLYTMRNCGAVGLLDSFTSITFRGNQLGPLAQELPMEWERQLIPKEELDALDPQAPWQDPEKLMTDHPELSEEALTAMEKLCQWELTRGVSREKCMEKLQEQLSPEEANQVLELCQVDFQAQALRWTLQALDRYGFSPASLVKDLRNWGFTETEAQYALQNCNADWYLGAELSVRQWIFYGTVSEEWLRKMMAEDGFDPDLVSRAIQTVNPDWNREALQEALSWDKNTDMRKTRDNLEFHLEWHGYTQDQVQYAADLMNLR